MPLMSYVISSGQNTDEIEMQKFYVFSINYLNLYIDEFEKPSRHLVELAKRYKSTEFLFLLFYLICYISTKKPSDYDDKIDII